MTYYEKWRQVGCANFSEGEFSFEDFEAAARDTFVGTQLLLRGARVGIHLSDFLRLRILRGLDPGGLFDFQAVEAV